jgi:predicted DCC family thiol-disulfide oxidoreductase YuxK
MHTTNVIAMCLYQTETDVKQNRVQSVKFFKSSSVVYEHNAINFEMYNLTLGCWIKFQLPFNNIKWLSDYIHRWQVKG